MQPLSLNAPLGIVDGLATSMHKPCLQVYIPTYLCSQPVALHSDLHVQLLVCNFNSCVEDSTELSAGFFTLAELAR